jgi:hypothetical protein
MRQKLIGKGSVLALFFVVVLAMNVFAADFSFEDVVEEYFDKDNLEYYCESVYDKYTEGGVCNDDEDAYLGSNGNIEVYCEEEEWNPVRWCENKKNNHIKTFDTGITCSDHPDYVFNCVYTADDGCYFEDSTTPCTWNGYNSLCDGSGQCQSPNTNKEACLQIQGERTSAAFAQIRADGTMDCCFEEGDNYDGVQAYFIYNGVEILDSGECKNGNWIGDVEVCNNKDDDYDGIIDNGCDEDGDGYLEKDVTCNGEFMSSSGQVYSCADRSGLYWGDCNDDDPTMNPGAEEICDNIDNNCNGFVDADDSVQMYDTELNAIQLGVCEYSLRQCVRGDYIDWYSIKNTDSAPAMKYYSIEEADDGGELLCDGYDNDCDGMIDEGCDSDLDGYIDITRKPSSDKGQTCIQYKGSTRVPQCADDLGNIASTCNGCGNYDFYDTDPNSFPGKAETCNGKDDNGVGFCKDDFEEPCSGDSDCTCIRIDEGCDMDGDGFLSEGLECEGSFTNFFEQIKTCTDLVDCDDTDPEHQPGRTWYKDADGDNYYASGSILECQREQDFIADEWMYFTDDPQYEGVDCDDTNAAVNPGQPEVCDGRDNNCDQLQRADENWYTMESREENTIQKGVCEGSLRRCSNGWKEWYDEVIFDKSTSTFYFGIPNYEKDYERSCDGLDNDCDGLYDEDFDQDGDGFTSCGTTVDGIDTIPNEVNDYSLDCDDTTSDDPTNCPDSIGGCRVENSKCAICRYPEAVEFCDSIQTDCIRLVENDDAVCADLATEYDGDGDGFCKEGTETIYLNDVRMCTQGSTLDCNDGDSDISPNAEEVCDGYDNNCNDLIDEGCDSDKDGYLDAQKICEPSAQCADDQGNARDCLALCDSLDCDDSNTMIYPGAVEECTSATDFNCDDTVFGDGREDDACVSTSESACDYFIEDYGVICKGEKSETDNGYWSECACDPYIEIVNPQEGAVFNGVAPVLEIATNLYSPVNDIPLASYRVSGGPTMTYYQKEPFAITRAYPDGSMVIKAFFDEEGTSLLGKDIDTSVTVTYIAPQENLGEIKESFTLNTTETSEDDANSLINELQNSVTASLHKKNSNVTSKDVDEVLEKTISTNVYSGKTEVSLNLNTNKQLEGTSVVLEIPKCAAELVQDIQFEDNSFEILRDDPVIAWHFSELSDDLDLTYRFNKELDAECLQQLKVLSLVDEIGEDAATDFLSSPLFAILLVPVVAGIMIYFSKFLGGNKVDRTVSDNISVELVNVVRSRKSQGQDDNEIIADLGNEGFSQSDVKNALKKL